MEFLLQHSTTNGKNTYQEDEDGRGRRETAAGGGAFRWFLSYLRRESFAGVVSFFSAVAGRKIDGRRWYWSHQKTMTEMEVVGSGLRSNTSVEGTTGGGGDGFVFGGRNYRSPHSPLSRRSFLTSSHACEITKSKSSEGGGWID